MREILNLAFVDGPGYRRELVDGIERFPQTIEPSQLYDVGIVVTLRRRQLGEAR